MGKSKIQEPTATKFSIKGFDRAHFRQTEQYVRMVDKLFDKAMAEIAKAAKRGEYDPNKPFTFDDYPVLKAEVEKIVARLAKNMTTTIETGSKNEWLFANKKNDGWIAAVFDTSKLTKAQLAQLQDRNLDALAAFQARKVQGLDLSQRVWRYVGQFKEQIQDCLDVGIGDGTSAMELASSMKKYLNNPNMLFRRVRDKNGNLHLSKRAAAYHPGRGVYRSSARNAQRLTRSEINMAYREADFQRWKSLDFVVGIEIQRSNNLEKRKTCKLCDRLAGRYPKDFKFVGWHPQCMCFATPIMSTEEEFNEDQFESLRAAFRGEKKNPPVPSQNTVVDVPDGFKEWVEENMERQENWASVPYFIRDNFKGGDLAGGLKFSLPDIKAIAEARINAARSKQALPDEDKPKKWEDCNKEERRALRNEWKRLRDESEPWRDNLLGDENNANLGDEFDDWNRFLNRCDPYDTMGGMSEDLGLNIQKLTSQWESIKSRYAAAREKCREEARKCLDRLRAEAEQAYPWIKNLESFIGQKNQEFIDETTEQYPDYSGYVRDWVAHYRIVEHMEESKKKYADAVSRGKQTLADAVAVNADCNGHDTALKSYISETPAKARTADEIVADIEREIKAVEDAIEQAKKNVGDAAKIKANGGILPVETPDWQYKPDGAKIGNSRTRLENLMENLDHYYGDDVRGYKNTIKSIRDKITQWEAEVANGKMSQRVFDHLMESELKSWHKVTKAMAGDMKPCLESINHLSELRAVKASEIPEIWRNQYNAVMSEINAHDYDNKGYIAMFPKIEKAYNIMRLAKLAKGKNAATLGLGDLTKVSANTPWNLFTEYEKKIPGFCKSIPPKEFWDSLPEFVPLVAGKSHAWCSPYYKYVQVSLKDPKMLDRLENSEVQRNKILTHEFGHAFDHAVDLRKNKDVIDTFDKFKKLIAADDAVGLESKIKAKLTEFDAPHQKWVDEQWELWGKTPAGPERDKIRANIFAQSDVWKREKMDMEEQLGALSDTLGALIAGTRWIGPRNHGDFVGGKYKNTYFKNRDSQLAEFIAHCSENYWSGNSLFKEIAPDLYEAMRELIKVHMAKVK